MVVAVDLYSGGSRRDGVVGSSSSCCILLLSLLTFELVLGHSAHDDDLHTNE